jgi:hypothetical protein
MATPYERMLDIRPASVQAGGRVRTARHFSTGATVLADTITNGIYGIGLNGLGGSADKAKETHPRLSKAAELTTKYAFWVGTAYIGASLSGYTGPAAGYTIAYAHPFVVGAAVKIARTGAPALDFRKPSLGIFLASFGLLELASTPIFIGAMDKITHLSGSVNAAVAALSFTLANAASLAFEYLGFRYLWRKLVLKDMAPGSVSDEAKGFLGEFNPLKLFRSGDQKNPASSAGGYVGQIWGNIESLWLWVQLAGLATAVAVAQLHPATPDNFIDLFFQKSALWGKKFLEALAIARCCVIVEKKIKENNEALGIDKAHS